VAFCDLDVRDTRKGYDHSVQKTTGIAQRILCRFLEYFTKEDAEHAIQTLNGATIKSCTVRVVDYAEVRLKSTVPSVLC
jgi:RNA recognition motif. (a.k.a. RRM, RBD, or RNP domain)